MQRWITFLILLSLLNVHESVHAQKSTNDKRGGTQPNIILILADDMGYSDIGCYGSEISTPNIDGLAKDGIRFTQFYNTSRCCPTRASLLSGLYPHQAGVGHMVDDIPKRREEFNSPAYSNHLNFKCVTIAEMLKENGYNTLMSGKWHIGLQPEYWPVKRGFDESFSLIEGVSNYFKSAGSTIARNDEKIIPDTTDFYITDAFSDSAAKFIEDYAKKDKPFFLYLAYTAPHWPLQARPEDIAKYRGKYKKGWEILREERYQRMIDLGIINRNWPLSPVDTLAEDWNWDMLSEAEKDEYDLRMAIYAAQIDRMDQGIGKVLAKLKESGKEENTLVFFFSDNGGCHERVERKGMDGPLGSGDSYSSYRRIWANASNTPFRYYKHWVHEGGIATPLIIKWPKEVKPSSQKLIHQPGHIIDIMATCTDAANAIYPQTYHGNNIIPYEGVSLMPLLLGEDSSQRRELYWEHEGNMAMREGKWKMVSTYEGNWELYDMEADRTEMNNLAEKNLAKLNEMKEKFKKWANRVGVEEWIPFFSPKVKNNKLD